MSRKAKRNPPNLQIEVTQAPSTVQPRRIHHPLKIGVKIALAEAELIRRTKIVYERTTQKN